MNRILAYLQDRFKNLDDLGTAFLAAGIVIVGLANSLNLGRVIQVGIALLGAGGMAWGANAIWSSDVPLFEPGTSVSQRVQELLARAWGIGLALGGLAVFGYGILSALNPRSGILSGVQQFFSTPQGTNVVLLGVSVVGFLFALSMIFVSDVRAGNSVLRVLLSLPRRFFGVLLLLAFLALGTITVIRIFAPQVWENLVHTFLRMAGFE